MEEEKKVEENTVEEEAIEEKTGEKEITEEEKAEGQNPESPKKPIMIEMLEKEAQKEGEPPLSEELLKARREYGEQVFEFFLMRRKEKRLELLLGIICCVFTLLLGVLFTMLYYRNRYEELDYIARAMNLVREEYYFYDEDTEEEINTGALKGIASYLDDKYANYYTPEEYEELLQTDSGNYVGMGVQVKQEDIGIFHIESVFPNTPASEAGLQVGDRLLSANGQSAEGMELDAFLELLGHEEGDENTVVVERDGEELSFTVTMREVYQPFVVYKMLEGNIGYICITEFHGDADEEVEKALEELREQGMEKLVLDLRDNPGGSLTTVCGVSELFLPKDSVITTIRSRNGGETVYRTHKEGTDIPMAVLINGSSASASELLSGALKDHERATLFGTTTYGKGIVQSFFRIRGGEGGTIKFTTDAYYTPNDVCIHGEGIAPDYEVEQGEGVESYAVYDIPYELDTQLQAAVEYLTGH